MEHVSPLQDLIKLEECAPTRHATFGGLLNGTTIMCQCHGSRFDITCGGVINGPATKTLNVYEVHEDEGRVRVRA